MIDNRSRYLEARRYLPAAEGEGFAGIRPREIATLEGVLEHVLQRGDRLDLLAREYYGDAHLWWRILDANPHLFFAGAAELDALAGQVLLIPGDGR